LAGESGTARSWKTAGERIAQLWHHQQQAPDTRQLSSSQLARRLGVSDSYVRHLT